MIKINLVPAEFLEKQTKEHRVIQAVAGGIFILAVVIVVSLSYMAKANALEAKLKQKEERLKQLQQVLDQIRTLESEKSAVEAHLNAINDLMKIRLVYTIFMQELVKSIPGAIWFSSLQTIINGNESVSFSLSATSRSAEDLAEWINILETGGKYSDIEIGAISIANAAAGKSLTFPLQAKYLIGK